MSEEALYRSVGGRLVAAGTDGASSSEGYWDFGWVPPENRSDEMHAADGAVEGSWPRFAISGRSRDDVKKVDLTRLWSHETVRAALGFAYDGTHQLTGSCVGAGAGNVVASVNFKEVIKDGDPEKIILPFYPYHYGRGRLRGGFRGRGEGSNGLPQAEAIRLDGVLDNNSHSELPRFDNSDGLIWGKDVEMQWSAGDLSPCRDWVETGKKYPIKTTARARSAADVRQGLVNLFPATCASMYGFNARVEKGVLLGRRGPRWGHQMSLHAFWEHPELGPIYWLMNQWGKRAHGLCPTGMPGGGAWITEADVEWICQTGEVVIFSGHDGYPAPDFDLSLVFG